MMVTDKLLNRRNAKTRRLFHHRFQLKARRQKQEIDERGVPEKSEAEKFRVQDDEHHHDHCRRANQKLPPFRMTIEGSVRPRRPHEQEGKNAERKDQYGCSFRHLLTTGQLPKIDLRDFRARRQIFYLPVNLAQNAEVDGQIRRLEIR